MAVSRATLEDLVLRRLPRFLVVGGGITLLVFLAFRGLLKLGMDPVPASALCWLGGLGLGYVLNKRVTFGLRRGATPGEVVVFVAGYVAQLLIGMGGYALLMKRWGLGPNLAFVLVTAVTAAFSFLFMRFAVFRPEPGPAGETPA